MDLAALAGLVLDPWQEYVLRGALGERRDGRWSSFRVALNVPRQNGKNALLEARELAGLFLFGEKLIIHTAHEYATARESMLALMNRIKATPDLLEHVLGFDGDLDKDIPGMKTGNDPGITLKNGNRLAYRARSKGSGRGFTGDLVVLDEAYALKLDEMAALLPTMAAKSIDGNPQVWFTSSAGMVDSDVLESLRAEGTEKTSDRLAYFEWSAPDDAKSDDVDAWYQANPGLGYRISEEFVLDEFKTLAERTGSDEQFRRERMGVWARVGEGGAISSETWAKRLGDPDENEFVGAEPGTPRVAFAADIPRSRDSATIVMAGDLGDGVASVVIVDRRQGTDWVAERLAELRDTWSPVAIVLDAMSQGSSVGPQLKRRKVRATMLNYREYRESCAAFFDAVMQGKVTHSGQSELDDAVVSAMQKATDSGLWKWGRAGEGDISPLVAATLALHGLRSMDGRTKRQGSKVMVMS